MIGQPFMKHLKKASLAALLGLIPSVASAAGFQVTDQHARATGRGGAYIANPQDAAAIYFNPAGIANIEGFNASIGLNVILPRAQFKADGTNAVTKASALTFFVPNIYASYRFSKLIGVGIGVNPSFGLTIKWPRNSPARTVVLEQQLTTFTISSVVAFNLSEWLPGVSLAVGPDFVPASVYLNRDIAFGNSYGSVELSGRAFGVGARAGLTIQPKPVKGLSFGFTWRSQVRLDLKGKANFTAPTPFRAELPPDGDGSTRITLPMAVSGGVAYKFLDGALELEADITWTQWSSYRELRVSLPGGSTTVSPKNWRDQIALRAGAEYMMTERASLRLGIVWDQYVSPDTALDFSLADADRTSLTAGLGYNFLDNLRADFGANFVLPVSRSTSTKDPLAPPFKGEYSLNAVVLGLSISGSFGAAGQ